MPILYEGMLLGLVDVGTVLSSSPSPCSHPLLLDKLFSSSLLLAVSCSLSESLYRLQQQLCVSACVALFVAFLFCRVSDDFAEGAAMCVTCPVAIWLRIRICCRCLLEQREEEGKGGSCVCRSLKPLEAD